jgi:hypothetical protein
MARKPTEYVQFKLRIRESLRRKIEKAAEKRAISANAEAVDRLEITFREEEASAWLEARDTKIVNLLIGERGDAERRVAWLVLSSMTDFFRANRSSLRKPAEREQSAKLLGETVTRAIILSGLDFDLEKHE